MGILELANSKQPLGKVKMSAKKKSSWFVSDFDDFGDDRAMGLIDVSKRGGKDSGSIEGHSNMKRSNSGGIAEHPLSSNKSKRPTEGSSSSNFYRGARYA